MKDKFFIKEAVIYISVFYFSCLPFTYYCRNKIFCIALGAILNPSPYYTMLTSFSAKESDVNFPINFCPHPHPHLPFLIDPS